MDIIKTIRDEIERRIKVLEYTKEQYERGEPDYDANGRMALDGLLSFLDTLEEPVNEELEAEIQNMLEQYAKFTDGRLAMLKPSGLEKIARHFAKWQAEQDNYDTIFHKGMMYYRKQMMEEAVEGEICHDRAGVDYLDYDIARLDKYIFSRFKVGDKVRIIVIPNTDEK